MCERGKCCRHPEKLDDKPEKCSPEQVKECHGDAVEHPCLDEPQENSSVSG